MRAGGRSCLYVWFVGLFALLWCGALLVFSWPECGRDFLEEVAAALPRVLTMGLAAMHTVWWAYSVKNGEKGEGGSRGPGVGCER